ncbi:Scr1 family TA system antitoxin-like transcriptional regulator [Amycolatopsis sp. FBCC-B4732]|nr:Scr1 family TA system antitoxin-like transcriptional regulator [Amycolatopsis sp. FBCC-B4732]
MAAKLGFSPSALSGWETGERAIEPGQLGWILGYLQVEPAERQLLTHLHRQSERTSYIESLTSGTPSLQEVYEQHALRTFQWAPHVVPDLLQTAEYAHAVLGRVAPADDVDQEILTRQVRQLDRDPRHRHTVLLGAAAVNHELVPPEVQRAQLRHITALADLGLVKAGVVRENLGPAGPTAPFVVYQTAAKTFTVVLRHEHAAVYLSDLDTVRRYRSTFATLQKRTVDYGELVDAC